MIAALPAAAWLLGAALVMAAIGATLAFAAQTQIFDPQTRKWVDYDKTKARKYYAAHKEVPEAFKRQVVKFRTAEKPGTIIIDGNQHFLYLVQPGCHGDPLRHRRRPRRFRLGGHRARRAHSEEWPTWTPPAEMVARDPNAAKWAGGPAGRT